MDRRIIFVQIPRVSDDGKDRLQDRRSVSLGGYLDLPSPESIAEYVKDYDCLIDGIEFLLKFLGSASGEKRILGEVFRAAN